MNLIIFWKVLDNGMMAAGCTIEDVIKICDIKVHGYLSKVAVHFLIVENSRYKKVVRWQWSGYMMRWHHIDSMIPWWGSLENTTCSSYNPHSTAYIFENIIRLR